jgi:hypothetical protein
MRKWLTHANAQVADELGEAADALRSGERAETSTQ